MIYYKDIVTGTWYDTVSEYPVEVDEPPVDFVNRFTVTRDVGRDNADYITYRFERDEEAWFESVRPL